MARNVHVLPVAISLLLHAAVGALFIWGVPAKEHRPPPPRPNFVRAQLVQLEEKPKLAPVAQPKPDPAAQQAAARRQREVAERQAAEQKAKADAEARKRAAEKAATEKAVAEKAAAERAAAKKAAADKAAAEKAAAERRAADAQRQRDQQRLAEALTAEQAALDEAAYASAAQSYIAAISQRIERHWSRPPSARNGMECELRIRLVPTGRVISVDVVRSSGNSQFDRSAVQAVTSAEQFPEVQEMDPAVFERHYRTLNLIFRPQDLRQ